MSAPLKLQVTPTPIHGLLVLEPRIITDERGWFIESFSAHDFSIATGLDVEFVQDNHSLSHQWTLRGLHFQTEFAQGKLVRIVAGGVFDVIVDIRKDSPTYGSWVGIELSSENHKQIWIPPGLAHGFLTLSGTAEVLYKVTNYHHPQSEVCLAWNDPYLNIQWGLPEGVTPKISAKDSTGLSWEAISKF